MRKPTPAVVQRDPVSALRARAARALRKGDPRKAVLALREAAALRQDGPAYVLLANALTRAGKQGEAITALKQALFFFRHQETRGRARTVARMILALSPGDSAAKKRAA